jgi:RNA polymerase sigma factor (sigma-70 family)
MSSLHRPALEGPSIFVCAQAGCPACLGRLLRQHRGLVRWVIRCDCRSDLAYDELFHEGQIALWQAILHYDPTRRIRFSTYAVPAIRHRLWDAVARAHRPHGYPAAPRVADPAEAAAAAWQRHAVRAALVELLAGLPEKQYHVIVAAYGLDGQPPLSLAAIGRLYGVSRERVRQWRNDALVLLRLPARSGRLRRVCEQNDKAAYQRAQALNQAWLRRRRGGCHG